MPAKKNTPKRDKSGHFVGAKKEAEQEDTNLLAIAKQPAVRKEPKASFAERTQSLQPWRDKNGEQVNQ